MYPFVPLFVPLVNNAAAVGYTVQTKNVTTDDAEKIRIFIRVIRVPDFIVTRLLS